MTVVLDASVAVKWYFAEPGFEAADGLLADAIERRVDLVAPDLIVPELANTVWKKARRGECSEDDAHSILALWEVDRPRLVESSTLAGRALELALQLDQTVYDCLYLAAAIECDASLATADARLARAARAIVELVPIA